MAGMTMAWGTKAAMVPAGALQRGSVAGAGVAVTVGAGAAVGLGRTSLRLQSKRARVSSPTEKTRSLTIVAVRTEGQTEIVSELTDGKPDVPEATSDVQVQAEELLKQVQATWQKVDDKLAIGGLGAVAFIVLWGSTGLISAIDKLPLVPQLLELVGLLFTGWFTYRYLLFKPDREELLSAFDDYKKQITGQEDL